MSGRVTGRATASDTASAMSVSLAGTPTRAVVRSDGSRCQRVRLGGNASAMPVSSVGVSARLIVSGSVKLGRVLPAYRVGRQYDASVTYIRIDSSRSRERVIASRTGRLLIQLLPEAHGDNALTIGDNFI